MNEQQNFFNLLKYSNQLKRNNKYLSKEDPEAFNTLLKFLVRIADNLHYSEKQEYIELAKDFLADQITADDFSYAFMAIYDGIGENMFKLKKSKNKKSELYLTPGENVRDAIIQDGIKAAEESISFSPENNLEALFVR